MTTLAASDGPNWRKLSPWALLKFNGGLLGAITLAMFTGMMPFIMGFTLPVKTMLALPIAVFTIYLLIVFLQFRRFAYQLTNEGVRIRKGLFVRNEVLFRYARVQAVQITSDFLFRLLGLTDVKLDTAGSAKNEGKLPAIVPDQAELIRQQVNLARSATDDSQSANQDSAGITWLHLPTTELIKFGLTSQQIFLIFAALIGVGGQLLDLVSLKIIKKWTGVDVSTIVPPNPLDNVWAFVWIAIGGLAVTTAVMVGGSIVAAIFRFHEFTLTRDGEQLRTRSGLLTINDRSVNRPKIQSVTWRQSWIRRLLNRVSIELRQAGHAASGQSKNNSAASQNRLFIPLCEPPLVERLVRFAWDGVRTDLDLDVDSTRYQRISPRFVRAKTLMYGLVPAVAFAISGIWLDWIFTSLLIAFAWLLVTWRLVVQRYRRWGIQLAGEAIAVRSGFYGYRIEAMACQKVQTVELLAWPWQQWAGITQLSIRLASHTVTTPYLRREDAARIRDELLYRVQTSNSQSF